MSDERGTGRVANPSALTAMMVELDKVMETGHYNSKFYEALHELAMNAGVKIKDAQKQAVMSDTRYHEHLFLGDAIGRGGFIAQVAIQYPEHLLDRARQLMEENPDLCTFEKMLDFIENESSNYRRSLLREP